MTTYQVILIILDTFEIIFIGALFGPGTAVGEASTGGFVAVGRPSVVVRQNWLEYAGIGSK